MLKGASFFKISTRSSRKVVLPDPGGPVIKMCGRSDIISRIELNTESWPYSLVCTLLTIEYLVLPGLRSKLICTKQRRCQTCTRYSA